MDCRAHAPGSTAVLRRQIAILTSAASRCDQFEYRLQGRSTAVNQTSVCPLRRSALHHPLLPDRFLMQFADSPYPSASRLSEMSLVDSREMPPEDGSMARPSPPDSPQSASSMAD